MNSTARSLLFFFGLFGAEASIATSSVDSMHFKGKAKTAAPNHSIWKTQGYGYILEVIDEDIRFYDVTKHHCLLNSVETGEYPSRNMNVHGNTAELDWNTVHPVKLTRLQSLPILCQQSLGFNANMLNKPFSAPEVFDVMWYTFAENFAFSKELQWNWQAKYSAWRNKVTPDMSETELADLIRNLIAKLGDAHAYVESDDNSFFTMHNIKWEKFKEEVIETKFYKQNDVSSLREFYQNLKTTHTDIIASYFDKKLLPQQLNRSMFWASLPNEVSYLSIDDMSEYTKEENTHADIKEVDRSMQHIMPKLINSKGLIIDLRWNNGGSDLVSNKILSYLIDKPLLVGSKSYRVGNGFSKPTNIIVQPASSTSYRGPIVALTSGITMSAAEAFLLGLTARKQVIVIGEPSNGGFSDSLPKQLPNGWTFTLSNERYFDNKGENHEYRGYPVSKNFEYLNADDLKNKRDSALIEAMRILK